MQHVGDQQLLVLLLVMQAKLDDGVNIGGQPRHRVARRRIDMAAILGDLRGGRARQQPARGTRMSRSDRLIVGIEQETERRIEHLIARHMGHQHELLEEPGGVGRCHFAGLASGIDWMH